MWQRRLLEGAGDVVAAMSAIYMQERPLVAPRAATAKNARQAFIKAAHEANIHIRSTEDPRKIAMRNPSKSQAWQQANRDAMRGVEKSVTKIKAERERFSRDGRNADD